MLTFAKSVRLLTARSITPASVTAVDMNLSPVLFACDQDGPLLRTAALDVNPARSAPSLGIIRRTRGDSKKFRHHRRMKRSHSEWPVLATRLMIAILILGHRGVAWPSDLIWTYLARTWLGLYQPTPWPRFSSAWGTR